LNEPKTKKFKFENNNNIFYFLSILEKVKESEKDDGMQNGTQQFQFCTHNLNMNIQYYLFLLLFLFLS